MEDEHIHWASLSAHKAAYYNEEGINIEDVFEDTCVDDYFVCTYSNFIDVMNDLETYLEMESAFFSEISIYRELNE